MITFHICLAVVWAGVSVTFALLAKYKTSIEGMRIWPDVLASVSAGVVAICYIVQILVG